MDEGGKDVVTKKKYENGLLEKELLKVDGKVTGIFEDKRK